MDDLQLLVSIITVTRNSCAFLEETIKSVSEQTYPRIEYIVIDGASTDDTVDIIEAKSRHIAKWISEPDAGIADAFNKGFSLSTGDYILFLNSDDRLAVPEVVETMVRAIRESGRPELIYGDYEIRDRVTDAKRYEGSVEFRRGAFLRGRVLPHPCLFTHRSYFQRFGAFDTRFCIAMDYEWMLRGALECRVVHVPYRVTVIRDGGISVNNPNTVKEIVGALRKNGHIRTAFGAAMLRIYFWMRSVVRRGLALVKAHRVSSARQATG